MEKPPIYSAKKPPSTGVKQLPACKSVVSIDSQTHSAETLKTPDFLAGLVETDSDV